jgi:chromosome segregation ATPase
VVDLLSPATSPSARLSERVLELAEESEGLKHRIQELEAEKAAVADDLDGVRLTLKEVRTAANKKAQELQGKLLCAERKSKAQADSTERAEREEELKAALETEQRRVQDLQTLNARLVAKAQEQERKYARSLASANARSKDLEMKAEEWRETVLDQQEVISEMKEKLRIAEEAASEAEKRAKQQEVAHTRYLRATQRSPSPFPHR